jgi:WD40 repeat protein
MICWNSFLIDLISCQFVFGDKDGQIDIYEQKNDFVVKRIQAHRGFVSKIELLLDRNIASSSEDFSVKIWNTKSNWTLIHTLVGHKGLVHALESININSLASGSEDETIILWDSDIGTVLRTIQANDKIHCLEHIGKTSWLAAGSSLGKIQLWDYENGLLLYTIFGQRYDINDLQYIPQNKLASSSNDGFVIWQVAKNNGSIDYNLTIQSDIDIYDNLNTNGLKLISSKILAGFIDHTIYLWDVIEETLIRTLTGHNDKILALDLFNEDILISGSSFGHVIFWKISTGHYLHTFTTDQQYTAFLYIKSDGKLL